MTKKVYLRTFGCQMNEYDSELVRGILVGEGFVFVENELSADIVMLNTCSVRENAHRRVYGYIHEVKHRRRGGGGKPVIIGVLGCMATNLRKDLLENKNLKIDFIAGPDSYKRLPDLIQKAIEKKGSHPFDLTLSEYETYSDIYPNRVKGINAWVAVMRGCNNFCTFCVVPYTRGRERSRSIENIMQEIRRLADEGFQQVTLLGQNVNSYRSGDAGFADLLEEVSTVEGIKRIRFTSPHPKDFPDKLIDVIANNPKVCSHIHLPLQAGNNRILELMNRTYTKEDFTALVKKLRERSPGIVLTTDIIVGFPTETADEFEETFTAMKEVEFDAAFIFKYSERKNTIASQKYPDDVPEEAKTERIVRLNELQRAISFKKNQSHIGEICDILLETQGTNHSDTNFNGRTDGNKIVTIPAGNYNCGQFLKIKITAATPHVLKGEILNPTDL